MATKIQTRSTAVGKMRYLARYQAPDGRWLSAGTFGDKKAAEKAALRAEEKAASQQWVDPRSGKVTFKSFVEMVYEPTMGTLEASTRRGYRSMLRTHLMPMWGSRSLSSIRPSQVATWVADPMPPRVFPAKRPDLAKKPRSPQKAVDAYALFRKILDLAVHDGLLVSNPCVGIKLPTQPVPEVKVMTPEEFDLVLSKISNDRNKAMLIVAVTSGLRWSELVALSPCQIDFLGSKTITVNRGLVLVDKTEGNGSRWVSKPYPKGRKTRTVLLDQEASEVLSYMIQQRGLAADSEEPIFVSRLGNPMDSTKFNEDVLKPALKAAGLESRGLTIKSMRSSYCSWLLAGGADIAVVQALMGHQQITTTQKYIQVLPESYDAAAKAFQSIRRRSS